MRQLGLERFIKAIDQRLNQNNYDTVDRPQQTVVFDGNSQLPHVNGQVTLPLRISDVDCKIKCECCKNHDHCFFRRFIGGTLLLTCMFSQNVLRNKIKQPDYQQKSGIHRKIDDKNHVDWNFNDISDKHRPSDHADVLHEIDHIKNVSWIFFFNSGCKRTDNRWRNTVSEIIQNQQKSKIWPIMEKNQQKDRCSLH